MTPSLRTRILAGLWWALVPSFATAQSNDTCSAATPITSLSFARTLSVDGATVDAADPAPSCGGGPNVWYRFTARRDVSLEIDTSGSSFLTAIAVYRGECDALTEVACSVPETENGRARLVVLLRKGEIVRIAVSGVSDAPGRSLRIATRRSSPRYREVTQLTEIVRSSDPSPYGGIQGTLLATVAQTDKRTAFAQSSDGLFVDVGGVLTTIAHSGSPAPGGGTFTSFGNPSASATGVVFSAIADERRGLYRWNGAGVEPLLPPGDAGTTVRSLSSPVAASESGTIAFLGLTVGDRNAKLLRLDGTTVTVVAARGSATACGGATIRGFESALAISRDGTTIAFVADLGGPGPNSGVFVADTTGLRTIACEDALTPLGGRYRSFGPRLAVNDLGEVYFVADDGDESIWVDAAGVTSLVAAPRQAIDGGETVTRIRLSQRLATNALGDVVFVADVGKNRAILRRARLASAPVFAVKQGDPCPLGGTFRSFDDELDLSAAGELVFDAECSGGHGAFRKLGAEAPIAVATAATTTAIGSGFDIGQLVIDATGTRVAGRGSRVALQQLTCKPKGCTPPVGVLVPGTPIANAAGQTLRSIDLATLAGNETSLVFVGSTAGVASRSAILRVTDGGLAAVASTGDPLPGGVGTFVDFSDDTIVGTTTDVGVGKHVVAFTAGIDHPAASHGLFAAGPDGLTTLALEGDPAPRGGRYTALGSPSVRGRSIVFAAETEEASCVFAVREVGKPIAAMVCTGDPAPPPLTGTIAVFTTKPSGSATDFYFAAETEGETSSRCLFRYQHRKASPVRCLGDILPNGSTYRDFEVDPDGIGPITDAGQTGVAFTDDSADLPMLLALRSDTFFRVLVLDATPAPLSGGVLQEPLHYEAGFTGKHFVVAAGIEGGTATSAVIRATLK